MVTVKSVGNECIVVESVESVVFALKNAIAAIVILTGVIPIISAIVLYFDGDFAFAILMSIEVTATIFGLDAIFHRHKYWFALTTIPQYRVYIKDHLGDGIEFPKVGDAEDQINICKAIAQFEPIALGYDEQNKKIICLAERCK